MNAYQLLEALREIDERHLAGVKSGSPLGRERRFKRGWILLAAVIAVLALCGFAAYRLALSDLWLQNPSQNPIETVQSALQNQLEKEYALELTIERIEIDQGETTRAAERYRGSELAQALGWTDQYLAEHFVAVRAEYRAVYDHTKTFLDDGKVCQYFYLTRDPKTGRWTIWDNMTAAQNHPPEG
ncbi:MAG: hypothetical protein HFK04_00550 [Oscillospiraceae bacterium]|nr:hypothetical protein [Oscillospiraceae bacterium]